MEQYNNNKFIDVVTIYNASYNILDEPICEPICEANCEPICEPICEAICGSNSSIVENTLRKIVIKKYKHIIHIPMN